MKGKGFNQEQWRTIYEFAQAALDLPESERRVFLEAKDLSPAIVAEALDLARQLSDEEAEPSRSGTFVGRFELQELLGSGAAGSVYSALDPELHRHVAIKILKPDQNDLPNAGERFIREARTASTLNHPNIVTVHEIIRTDTTLAIVMELIDGVPLRSVCGEPLPTPRLLSLARQTAEALAAAHAAGIVHRDIKPENLMLVAAEGGSAKDRVKVLDFGLARLNTSNTITAPGLAAGTLRYMSPEHYHGAPLTSKSDIFALGLVLYELAVGQHPFGERFSLQVLHAIATEPVTPPIQRNPALLPALNDLILRMLAKSPEERPDAAEVAQSLSNIELQFSADIPSAAHPVPGRTYNRALLAFVVVAALIAGAFFWRQYWNRSAEASATRLTALIAENRATASAISPDGKYLAYGNADGVFLLLIASGEVNMLKSPAEFVPDHLSWMPDSGRLLLSGFKEENSQPSLWWISLTGSEPRLLREGARWGSISPDAKSVAFLGSDYSSIWTIGTGGESERRIIDAPESDTFRLLYWAANSRHLLVNRQHFGPAQTGPSRAPGRTDTMESIDSQTGTLASQIPNLRPFAATPLANGELLVLSDERREDWGAPRMHSLQVNLNTGQFEGDLKPLPLPADVVDSRCSEFTSTPDGSRLALIRQNIAEPIFVADFNRQALRISNLRRLTLDDAGNYPHSWTADSAAVIYESGRSGHGFKLYRHGVTSRVPELLTGTSEEDDVLPQLSADQSWILFARQGRTRPGLALYRVSPTGGAVQEVPTAGTWDQFRCSVSKLGRCVLRRSIGEKQYVYHDLDPVKGAGVELARVPWSAGLLGDWDISPDGNSVIHPNHSARSAKVRVIHLNIQKKAQHETEVTIPALTSLSVINWAADGSGWFLSADTSVGRRMYFWDLRGHLSSLGAIHGWAVPAPDGKKVAFLNRIDTSNVWMIERPAR